MNTWMILAPLVAVGIGMAGAYTTTHRNRNEHIHFVKRDNLQTELLNLEIEIDEVETCIECSDEIKPEDIGAVIRLNGEYGVICSDRACLDIHDIHQESLDSYSNKSPSTIS